MHPLEHTPGIYGQIFLAVLILINSIFSWWQKKKMEKREEGRQEEIADNLILSQKLVMQHSQLLTDHLKEIQQDIATNTQVNVAALETANGYNEKIASSLEVAVAVKETNAEVAARLRSIEARVLEGPQQVEIVQNINNPIPVHEVEVGNGQ